MVQTVQHKRKLMWHFIASVRVNSRLKFILGVEKVICMWKADRPTKQYDSQ